MAPIPSSRSSIRAHLTNRRYLTHMIVTNLLVVPALMVFAMYLANLESAYATGLVLFGISAGAPFLIKLTATSENDIALGATVLMVLMLATVVVIPVLLPRLINGVTVDAGAIVATMLKQITLPMLVALFEPPAADTPRRRVGVDVPS